MPKKRKPAETFDEFIGVVIDSRRALEGMSQDDLASAIGLPLTNLGRSLRGTRPLSINEFERIAGALGEDAGEMAAEALRRFGGMEKLLAGYVSETSRTVEDHDNVTYLGRVTPPLDAAADGNPRHQSRTEGGGMRELIAHAATLGVTVHVAHLPAPYRGFYDAEQRRVVYGFDLTPIERMSVLAHELGHAFYDHRCKDDPGAEAAADLYAARLLIAPEAYAAAAAVYPHAHGIAEELGVEERLVEVFEARVLTRFGERTYSHSRMGAGQYVHAWG